MDIATLVGLILAVALILGSILIGTCPITAFYDLPSVLVVFGGAAAATMICFPLRTLRLAPLVLKKVFSNKPDNVPELIAQIVRLAEVARREGLLALENRIEEVGHAFIKLGIQMAVDGTRPEVIEDVMRTEIDGVANRHRDGKCLVDQLGRFAPAYGMIGTLLGLIMMLSNMSDPSGIGAGMAVALITTLYGSIASNVIFIPFAEKLSYLNKQEINALEIIVRGILAIQSGENPRVIAQKLSTFLPPKLRPREDQAA